jgi:hypothetical protein
MSKKECNYEIRASQSNLSLTKFIVNNISNYVFKQNLLWKYIL